MLTEGGAIPPGRGSRLERADGGEPGCDRQRPRNDERHHPQRSGL